MIRFRREAGHRRSETIVGNRIGVCKNPAVKANVNVLTPGFICSLPIAMASMR